MTAMHGWRKTMNIAGLLLVLIVNTLAQVLPINGVTTGEISDRHHTYVTPAGYVFTIWSVIYLGLIGFVIYQARKDTGNRPAVERISYWFVVSCLLNSAWIFLWHYEKIGWSTLVMAALLLTLIAIYQRIRYGRESRAIGEYSFVQVPFSLYLGWICVASIVNVTVWLQDLGWNGWGIDSRMWAVILLTAAGVLAVAFSYGKKDVPFALVFVWAFIGIGVEQQADTWVRNAAWSLAAIVGAATLWLLAKVIRDRKRWDQSYISR
ncbi:hypothetical protein HMPREF9413_2603 [Paenibacillus sp. HGF7]|nr:hypothetical protein HMPREF9413_2603 [Paenibacillus sp. HGF7]EPD92867.1 hypothetical protein HMPREF1207_00638 [Paenibacillus sp. HGH0039]MBV6713016.1 tryptophan-rich sensory protein [Paenibacillus chitinolyticus]